MTMDSGLTPVALRTRAFGVDLESTFPLPGLEPAPLRGDGRSLSLDLGSQADVEAGFPEHPERIAELVHDGRLIASVDDGGEDGYLAHAFDFGHARLSPDGRRILISPFDEPSWIWQRYLTGQLLPLAALLQGIEVFHACVLGLEGKAAIAIVAPSGIGKTTMVLRLALEGLDFMADDVLAIEPHEGGVRAHPGVGLANVRPGADDLLERLEQSGLAAPVGRNERETRISIRRFTEPLPLASLFVLNRFVDDRPLEIESLSPVDPRVLLASTFNFAVRTPERLARQLDVCAHLERSVSVHKVTCGIGVPPEEVVKVILEQASASIPC